MQFHDFKSPLEKIDHIPEKHAIVERRNVIQIARQWYDRFFRKFDTSLSFEGNLQVKLMKGKVVAGLGRHALLSSGQK